MATLEDLNPKSISEMTDDELYELIRQKRLDRSKPAKNPNRKKGRPAKKAKPEPQVNPENLSSEDANKLLEALGGMINDG